MEMTLYKVLLTLARFYKDVLQMNLITVTD